MIYKFWVKYYMDKSHKLKIKIYLKKSVLDILTEDTIDDDDNYFFGFVTRKLLQKKFIEGEITLDQRDFFINAIIAFYKKRLRYLLTKMNVENNTKPTKGSNIEYFVSWYSGILQFDDYEIEKVYEGRIWAIWIVYNWFTKWYSNGIWRRLQGV